MVLSTRLIRILWLDSWYRSLNWLMPNICEEMKTKIVSPEENAWKGK
jgi:hypothetical protein